MPNYTEKLILDRIHRQRTTRNNGVLLQGDEIPEENLEEIAVLERDLQLIRYDRFGEKRT